MSTESQLISETEKWLKKAETEFAKIMASTDAKLSEASSKTKPSGKNHLANARSFSTAPYAVEKGEEFAKNIAAYLNDCKYFSEKKHYVRAFEAVVWAWAWIEIGKEIRVLEEDINRR